MKLFAIQILLGVFAGQTIAAVLDHRSNATVERRGRDFGTRYNWVLNERKTQGPFHFRQKVDHRDPASAEFPHRYWVKDTYYQRGHSPIFLFVGGELSASNSLGYLEENSMIVRMAKENQAMVVLLEHRYFGQSFPVENLSDENMKYLTIEQTLADLNHFATQGMGSSLDVKPDMHPWILLGNSYAGGLVSWALLKYGKTFYAGYSSSGTVHAKAELWEYWDNIYERMSSKTPDCVERVEAVLEVFHKAAGSTEDHTYIKWIRKQLKMSQIERLEDMADILSRPLSLYPQPTFYKYCKALSKAKTLDAALAAIGHYNEYDLQVDATPLDWSSHNPDSVIYSYEDHPDLNSDSTEYMRQWSWLRCNELGWFLPAPPSGSPIVSKYLTIERDLRQCSLRFPTLRSAMTLEALTQRVEKTNELYGGYNKRVAKLMDVNGEYDAWRSVSFRSPNSPQIYRDVSFLIPGDHVDDMAEVIAGRMDQVQRGIQRIMGGWFKEWSPPA